MLISLFLCLVGSATATLDASALDTSPASLAGATSVVEIGAPTSADDGHDDGHAHDHGGSDGSDDVHEYWSAIPSSPTSYEVVLGSKLSFKYSVYHNVYLMPSPEAYSSCNFAAATELANTSFGGGTGSFPNVYEAVATSVGTLYFACQVAQGGHCTGGQKITVSVVAATTAAPPVSSSALDLAPDRLGVLLLAAASGLLAHVGLWHVRRH